MEVFKTFIFEIVPNSSLNPLWSVLVGWVLGLLTIGGRGLIVGVIQKRNSKKAILIELDYLRFILADKSLEIGRLLKQIDRGFLKWYKDVIDRYDGPGKTFFSPADLKKCLDSTEDDEIMKLNYGDVSYHNFQIQNRIDTPIITAYLSQVGGLSPNFQRHFLDIFRRIKMINLDIEHCLYIRSTHDNSSSAIDKDSLYSDFLRFNKHLFEAFKSTIDSINALEECR